YRVDHPWTGRGQGPLPRGATPAAGAAATIGSRVGHGQQPLAGALQLAPFAGVVLQARPQAQSVAASSQGRLPPLAGTAGLPFGLALVAASRPLVGGLGRGLAMGGRPYMRAGRPSSLLPSLRKHNKNT
ncbi:hypothetical protein BHE74_00041368, partial [Ensete ventricosum]